VHNDLDLLITAARTAGDIARGYFNAAPEVWEKSGGQGPVTEADLHVNRQLESDLQSARPDYGWLSEETEDGDARRSTDRQFIIDPIDGTRAFIEGSKDWAHSIAITENGQPVAAVIYLPIRDCLYAAQIGQGATCNGAPIKTTPDKPMDSATVLSARPNMDPKYWSTEVPPFKRTFRSSLAYRLALVAEGRFDGMLTLRPTPPPDQRHGGSRRHSSSSNRRARLIHFTRAALSNRVAATQFDPQVSHGTTSAPRLWWRTD